MLPAVLIINYALLNSLLISVASWAVAWNNLTGLALSGAF